MTISADSSAAHTPNAEAFAPERLAEVHEEAGTAFDKVSAAARAELGQADYGARPDREALGRE